DHRQRWSLPEGEAAHRVEHRAGLFEARGSAVEHEHDDVGALQQEPAAPRQHGLTRHRDQLTAKLLSLDDAALELQPIQVDGAATGVAGGKQLAAPVLSEKAAELLQVGGFSGEA